MIFDVWRFGYFLWRNEVALGLRNALPWDMASKNYKVVTKYATKGRIKCLSLTIACRASVLPHCELAASLKWTPYFGKWRVLTIWRNILLTKGRSGSLLVALSRALLRWWICSSSGDSLRSNVEWDCHVMCCYRFRRPWYWGAVCC